MVDHPSCHPKISLYAGIQEKNRVLNWPPSEMTISRTYQLPPQKSGKVQNMLPGNSPELWTLQFLWVASTNKWNLLLIPFQKGLKTIFQFSVYAINFMAARPAECMVTLSLSLSEIHGNLQPLGIKFHFPNRQFFLFSSLSPERHSLTKLVTLIYQRPFSLIGQKNCATWLDL